MTTALEVGRRFVAATVGPDPDALAALYGEEVTIEMPFGPPLLPARTVTSGAELAGRRRARAAPRRYTAVTDVHLHGTGDPAVAVVEYRVHGETVEPPVRTFELPIVMVMTVRDGRIVHTRDYNDPVAGAYALGIVPRLVEALHELTAGTGPA